MVRQWPSWCVSEVTELFQEGSAVQGGGGAGSDEKGSVSS